MNFNAYLYKTSPVDGLPVIATWNSTAIALTESDVAEWHVAKQYGGRRTLGATLKDGRIVFVVRSEHDAATAKELASIADRINRGFTRYTGSSATITFRYL